MVAAINWGDSRLPERFWSKVQPEPMSGCWLWIGAADLNGYGRLWTGTLRDGVRGASLSHRVAYEKLVEAIPDGLHIDHLCRVPSCCNPAHMEPVTNYVNTMRGENFTAKHARATHCPAGHAYDSANTRIDLSRGRPRRICIACKRIANAKHGALYRARRRAA